MLTTPSSFPELAHEANNPEAMMPGTMKKQSRFIFRFAMPVSFEQEPGKSRRKTFECRA
jgi:hypothetical protein